MIFTSYYAKADRLDGVKLSVSITTPGWADVDGHWNAVKPDWHLIEKFKNDADEAAYTEAYNAKLAGLDLTEDIKVLRGIRDNVFLMCYEAPDKFCHRHLLAEHINSKYGLDVREYEGGIGK